MTPVHLPTKTAASLLGAVLALSLLPTVAAQEAGDRPSSSPPPVCEKTLTAQTREGGAIFLDWEPANEKWNDLSFYRVMRDGENIGEVQDTEFLDATAEPGVTYTYQVQAHGGAAGGGTVFTSCGTAEVTAVPFFGAPAFALLALVGSVGAFAWMRRRG